LAVADVTSGSESDFSVALTLETPVKLIHGDCMHFDLLAFYGGPDQVMTITSGIASLVGFLLIFWHKLVNAFFRLIGRGPKPTDASQETDDTGTTHS
jgi:hypothetical protein